MRNLILSICLLVASASAAMNVIDIRGKWHATWPHGKAGHDVLLPGSLLTNSLGDEISLDTKWTGSLYDSSYYYNPAMAPYRRTGHLKFPFFLTPNKLCGAGGLLSFCLRA